MMKFSLRNSVIWTVFALIVTMMFMSGCGSMEGEVDINQPPNVSFVTVPEDSSVFDYAPVIYWTGNDPDGFVKHYSYADIIDAEAIANPIAYIDKIPDEAWVDTLATQAQIFLLTDAGDTTEHIFYIRCTDNLGLQSEEVKYRTFFRTNNAPNIPRIGPTGTDETLFSNRYVVQDTLFSAPSRTAFYPGIQFTWRGSDPDDKALYTIPLEFKASLVKAPSDTQFTTQWNDDQELNITDLETGFYTLNVWARDDGLTESVAPARVEFNVINPTFEHNLLVIMENFAASAFGLPTADSLTSFYPELLAEIAPQLENVDLDLDDGVDVKFLNFTNTADALISKSLISQYKMVIIAADQFNLTNQPFNANYVADKTQVMEEYLRVGGRVWTMGRMIGRGSLNYRRGIFGQQELMMFNFFGVEDIEIREANMLGSKCYAEWIGTSPGIQGMTGLTFDSTKVDENFPPGEQFGYVDTTNYGQSGVDPIARTVGAQTTQYFSSFTAGRLVSVENENVHTIEEVDAGNGTFLFPPTSTQCYLQTAHPNVKWDDDYPITVINETFRLLEYPNYQGEVQWVNNDQILISYSEGIPWSNSVGSNAWNERDSIRVSYTYDPISEMHLKPCEIRVEMVDTRNNAFNTLRFRTAVSSFSYYFVKEEETVEVWTEMLDWFFNPQLNTTIYDN
jgi:hypothetical protein